ncbi:hypothetical protein Tco_1264998 [Tanacetum coccineum]
MSTLVIDLTVSQPASTTIQASLPTSTAATTITTTTLPPPSPQPQQGISNSIIIQRIGELERCIADQVDANQALEERLDKQGNRIHQLETQDLSRMIREQTVEYIDKQEIDQKIKETVKEAVTASVQYAMRAPLRARFKDLPTSDMKEILLQRMLEENYDKGHEDHRMAYEALQKSILRDESEQFDADKAEERKKMKRASDTIGASDSTQDPFPPPQSPTTNPDDQSPGSAAPGSSKTAATTAYTAWTTTTSRFEPSASSIPEDVFMHEESDFEAQDMVFDDEDIGSRHVPRVNLNQDWFKPLSEDERPATPEPACKESQSSALKRWKALHMQLSTASIRLDSSPISDGGMSQASDQLSRRQTSQMKAAYYPDVGLEQMVPDQMWIEEECMYDISATYGISHWSPEPPTAKGQEDSLYCCQLMDQESGYQTTGLEFIHTTRFILLQEPYCSKTIGMHMLMRFNEIHKFSDRTLQQIDEALDYRVKEFKVNKNNLALNTRFWTTNELSVAISSWCQSRRRPKARESFGTWKALLVQEYAKETTDFYGEPNDDIF